MTSEHGAPVARGRWAGTQRGGVESFHGIRYARLGNPRDPRSAPLAATAQMVTAELTDVPVFPQLPSRLEVVTGPGGRVNPQDAEAFFLNVWAPVDAAGLPVLVFIHGGAWASGGGSMRWYRGERLASEGVVVVTLNYRLGPAGHLDTDAGHVPFADLNLALRWVQEHIAAFGGDPDRVTLSGQSAGGWYTWALAALPEGCGLFRQAAVLSAPWIAPWTRPYRQDFTQAAQGFRDAAGGDLGWLQAGAFALAETPRVPGAMPPMYLPSLSGEQAERLASATAAAQHGDVEALYVRVTHHEMSVFLPWDQGADADAHRLERLRADNADQPLPGYPAHPDWEPLLADTIALSSWQEFGRFGAELVAAQRDRGRPAVFRDFGALAGPVAMGAAHCLDLPFQFGNYDDWSDAPMLFGWDRDAFERVSAEVRADLVDFVTGTAGPDARALGAPADLTT